MLEQRKQQRQPFSLSVRVSGSLVLAAILPLIFTVAISELISRPTLIAQAGQEISTDARTRSQSIDSYFSERIRESEALSRLQPIQNFLAGDDTFRGRALDSLTTGHGRGSYYEDWSLIDLKDNLRLYSPTAPRLHGQSYISSVKRQQVVQSRKTVLSEVFFSPISNEAYIDIYVPIVTSSKSLNFDVPSKVVGFLRSSFDLHFIWQIVDNEAGANGPGSYACILDQQGSTYCIYKPSSKPIWA